MSSANEVVGRRRPVPREVPGWVVWLLGLDQPETNKRIVWIILLGAAVTVAAARLTTVPLEDGKHFTVAGAWAITTAMVLIVLAALGMQRLYRVGGILIGDRNVMSLTRFQVASWTVLIGSALLTLGLCRAFSGGVGNQDALNIIIPDPVWQLLGISGGSTILATMIKKNKQNMEPAGNQTARTASMIEGETPASVEANRQGILYGNSDPKDARFMDMLEGDEVGNSAYLDIAKVQMFFFTVIALLLYGGVLWDMFYNKSAAAISSFPDLTPTLVTITGISHAAYLGTKAVTQTTTDPNATPKPADPPPAQG